MLSETQQAFVRLTAAAIIAAVCSKLQVEPSSGRRSNDPAAAKAFLVGAGREKV
jgi:hypothetical protein